MTVSPTSKQQMRMEKANTYKAIKTTPMALEFVLVIPELDDEAETWFV
jgi:hypothetical protein